MNCKINWDDGVFAVPDKVTDGLKLASGKSLKLLIYYLRYRKFPDDPSVIGAGADDIEDAVNYWQQVGIFEGRGAAAVREKNRANEEDEGEQMSFGENGVNALNGENSVNEDSVRRAEISEDRGGRITENVCAAAAEMSEKSCGGNSGGEAEGEKKKRVNVISVPSRKSVLPAEIAERIEKSDEVAFMFRTAEAELKRVLTFDDQRTLLWIHDHLGMSADVVVMIVAFCCRRWGASMKKIEDTAVNMYEREIVTHESVNRELAAMEQRSSYEGKIKAKLGIQTALTPRQKEYAEEWCGKGISIELVAKAYYITMEAKGKADFRYMGDILKKWYDSGVTTPEAADGFDDREKSAAKPAAAGKQPGKRDKSNGNAAPSYDLAAMLAEDRKTAN